MTRDLGLELAPRTGCARCGSPAAGVVGVAELDAGRGLEPAAEFALCVDHLADVAQALGFERPHELRAQGATR